MLVVVIAAVLGMVVGFIWYGDMAFGQRWRDLTGIKSDSSMGEPMLTMMVGLLVMAYAYGQLLDLALVDSSSLSEHLTMALYLWVPFTFVPMLSNHRFKGRDLELTFIESGYNLAVMVVFALVFFYM